MTTINRSTLAVALNQVGADYKEGCDFVRSYEKNNSREIVDWAATDRKLLSSILTPFHDGWTGMVLMGGELLQHNGTNWH